MFTENLSVFMGPNDPGVVSALYDGAGTIYGEFSSVDQGAFGVASTNPTFLCATSAVAANPRNKTLVINAVNYKVRDAQPQDDGAFTLLQLEKQ